MPTSNRPVAGAPGGSTTQVQFNDAGVLGGDAGLVYNKTTDRLTVGELPVGAGNGNLFNIDYTANSTSATNTSVASFYYTDTAASGGSLYANLFGAVSPNNAGAQTEYYGAYAAFVHGGTGIVTTGVAWYSRLLFNNSGATITNAYNYYIAAPFINGSTITNEYGYYAPALGGTGTNVYSFWSDEAGVFRIRSDNTFNSVYQAIPALYNPQFTKYTPGAANYERVVMGQWSSNVAEIGTEAGGTGTLRNVRILATSLELPATNFGGSAGVRATAAAGVLTLAGLSGQTENLTFDFAGVANTVTVGTGTGVTKIDFGSIILEGAFSAADGTAGVSVGPFTTITAIQVKNGLVTTLTGA